MSRVARNPVEVPGGVSVSLSDAVLIVSGPKGKMTLNIHASVRVLIEGAFITVEKAGNSRLARALSGTFRALIQNIVTGVTVGFQRKLILFGTGYKAQVQGKTLVLSVGYSHPVHIQIPEGVSVVTPLATEIVFSGSDKQAIGQIAASVRAVRPLEPYKGKGIRYDDEAVVLKEVKKK